MPLTKCISAFLKWQIAVWYFDHSISYTFLYISFEILCNKVHLDIALLWQSSYCHKKINKIIIFSVRSLSEPNDLEDKLIEIAVWVTVRDALGSVTWKMEETVSNKWSRLQDCYLKKKKHRCPLWNRRPLTHSQQWKLSSTPLCQEQARDGSPGCCFCIALGQK